MASVKTQSPKATNRESVKLRFWVVTRASGACSGVTDVPGCWGTVHMGRQGSMG